MVAIKGGDKLEAALRKLSANVTKAATVEIGYPAGSTHTDKDGNSTSLPLIAALNEFGRPDKGQPPRPFFRNMIAAKSGEWPEAIAGLLKANDFDAAKTLGLTGQAIADQLQQSIVDFTTPALSPVTIAAKGSAKPLVESGQMLKEVKFVVK